MIFNQFCFFFTFLCRYWPVLFVILHASSLNVFFNTMKKKISMSETYLLSDFEFVFLLTAFVPIVLPTLTTQFYTLLVMVRYRQYFTLMFFILPCSFTLFNWFLIHSNVGFALFCFVIALHHFQRFFILHFHVFSMTRCHHSYNELVSFAFFVFVRHTTPDWNPWQAHARFFYWPLGHAARNNCIYLSRFCKSRHTP